MKRASAGVIRFALAALVVAAILAVYTPSLPYPFVYDDVPNIAFNPSLFASPWGLDWLPKPGSQVAGIASNRPVTFYTFLLNAHFGGLNPWGFRLVNVLLHALNALLFALLARRLLGCDTSLLVVFGAVLLWALNPVQTAAVTFIVQRCAVLATTFCLAASLAYLGGRREGARWKPLWFAGSGLLWLLGCGAKEIAWVMPLFILLFEAALSPGPREQLRRRLWIVPGTLALPALLFPLALHRYGAGFVQYPFTWQERVLTELRVVAHYLGLAVFPAPSRLVADYAYPLSRGFLDPPTTLAALIAHAVFVGVGFVALRRRPLVGACILGFYLANAVESTVIPLDLVYEHRLYLPSLFLFLGGAALADEVRRNKADSRTIKAAGFLFLGTLVVLWGLWTGQRNRVWENDFSLWSDTVEKQPANARAWGSLGTAHLQAGRFSVARQYLSRSLSLNPNDPMALANLARAVSSLGESAEALGLLERALLVAPGHPVLFLYRGIVEGEAGKWPEAVHSLERALTREPGLPGGSYLLGRAYWRVGKRDRAILWLERELARDPNHGPTREVLERILRGEDGLRATDSPRRR